MEESAITSTPHNLAQFEESPIQNANEIDNYTDASLSFVDDDTDDPLHIQTESDVLSSKKYVVYESKIDELLLLTRPVRSCEPSQIDKLPLGSSLHATLHCINGHKIIQWTAQPTIGKMPAYSLLFASSIFLSGKQFFLNFVF